MSSAGGIGVPPFMSAMDKVGEMPRSPTAWLLVEE
jgi:hypothetical protein